MTFSAADPGALDLLQRLRQRLVETENQLRGLRTAGWRPDSLRGMNEEIGRLHAAAARVAPDVADAIAPLLQSLHQALASPSLPGATQTDHLLEQAGAALAALPIAGEAPSAGGGNPAATS